MAIRELGQSVRERLTFSGNSDGEGLITRRRLKIAFIVLALLLIFYYPVGALLIHKIDDDLDYKVQVPLGSEAQSRAVAMAASLIDREVNKNGWTRNDPFFQPAAILDNMPNFQQGIIDALGRFAYELADQIGRRRGSSQVDPDLEEVSGALQISGNRWMLSSSAGLQATSESEYNKAYKALVSYNERVARGDAVFERRADNLLATLDRIALDLGSSSDAVEKHLVKAGDFGIDREGDNIFYTNKGQLYAYYMVLRELGVDFQAVIEQKDITKLYAEMLETLRDAAELQPWIVINGSPDGLVFPSHLASQGFYLLRARTKMREITNVLLK